MQPRPLPNDVLVIDDSYNANPQSMRNALETLARLDGHGRRLVALGQMGELGDEGDAAHRDAGRLAGSLGLDEVFLLGPMADLMAEGAREAGLAEDQLHVFTDHESLSRSLRERIAKGDRILVKGSRAARMERIVEELEKESR
jgi:UDP-N-acetylmuramoyl-tripeptide--D-alanyl-D-alanine ligase